MAAVTQTSLHRNLRLMLMTSGMPLILTSIIYGMVSLRYPLTVADNSLMANIPATFSVHPITLLPAVLLIVLTLLRRPVRLTLWLSLGVAIALALTLQSQSLQTVIDTLLWGFRLPADTELGRILQGGRALVYGQSLWRSASVDGVGGFARRHGNI